MADKKKREVGLEEAKDVVKELVNHTIKEIRASASDKKVKSGLDRVDFYPHGINQITFSVGVESVLEFTVEVIGPDS